MRDSTSGCKRWIGLLAVLLLGGVWMFDRTGRSRHAAPEAAGSADEYAVGVQPAADVPASSSWFATDDQGCLVPRQVAEPKLSIERPDPTDWQAVGLGDRLREDACGNVWGLWFNSFSAYVGGDPERAGHVGLPTGDSPIGRVGRFGVIDFLPRRGELWLLGRQSELARFAGGRWHPVPPPLPCFQGEFIEFDGEVWLGCRGGGSGGIFRWDDSSARWHPMTLDERPTDLLRVSTDGRLIAAAGGRLAWMFSAAHRQWRTLIQLPRTVTALAADGERIAVADELGLSVYDWQGQLLFERRPLAGIRNLVWTKHGLWLAVRRRGLLLHDGDRWHDWTYAEGLPDDSARDLLLDSRQRLWLGGSPGMVIDAAAAAAQVARLTAPAALDGRIYPNACAAAEAELQARAGSGRIAQVRFDGQHLVFFSGEQVCPDPWKGEVGDPMFVRRDADGALLRIPHNGRHSSPRCDGGCSGSQREAMQARWSLSLWHAPRLANKTIHLRQQIEPPDPLPAEAPLPRALLPDDGSVWVATHAGGLWRYAGGGWTRYADADGFSPSNRIQALAADRRGRIWVTSRPDAYALEQTVSLPLHLWENGAWQHLDTQPGRSSLALDKLIPGPHSMFIGSNGELLEANALESIATAMPAQRGWFADMVVDDAGYRWIAHEGMTPHRGLAIAEPSRLRRIDSRQGLFADPLRRVAYDDRGNIWLLAEDGRVAIYARQLLFTQAKDE